MRGRKLWWVAGGIVLLFTCCGLPFWYLISLERHVRSLVLVHTKNPELDRAIKAAKKTLPNFEQHLKHPEPGERFAIKVGFETPYGPEYLWLKDPEKNAKGFSAVVDQHPVSAPVKMGERIQVRASDVYDWLAKEPDGQTIGGVTDRALAATQK